MTDVGDSLYNTNLVTNLMTTLRCVYNAEYSYVYAQHRNFKNATLGKNEISGNLFSSKFSPEVDRK